MKVLNGMKKDISKILLLTTVLVLNAGLINKSEAASTVSLFERKFPEKQATEIKPVININHAVIQESQPKVEESSNIILESKSVTEESNTIGVEEIEESTDAVYPAVVNISKGKKTKIKNKVKKEKIKKKKKIKEQKPEEALDIETSEIVADVKDNNSEIINTEIGGQEEISIPEVNEPELTNSEPKKVKKKRGLKKNKKNKAIKKNDNEHKLSKIETIIENEPYLNHNTENDIYLDKYKRKELSTLKEFYEDKDIIENPDGSLSMVMKSDDRAIDKLIDEIENINPNNTFTPALQLTLKECIGIALLKHPDILSARLNTGVYKDRITQSWAAYFPSLSAGIDYNKYHNKYGHYSHSYNSHYMPNVSAGLMLFDFGKTKTNVDIAKTDYEASKFNLESSINEIIYAVKTAYYNLLFAQKQIDVYQNTIEDFELQLKVAKKYFEIGKKPQIDVTMAEYNLGNAKLNLVKAINTLEVARVQLANTMGLPAFANFELADTLPVNEYDTDLEVLMTDAFKIRPDLLSQEKAVEAAYLGIRSAKRNFAPDLVANGTYYRGKSDRTDESNFQVGVDLTYSGLNLMQIKKEHDIAKKSYEKALADYERSKQNVYLEVKQAYINLSNTKNTVKQAEMNVAQAKEQNYHATGRYNAGYGDAIELKDAENTYLSSQLEYYQALLEYNTGAANIERLVGRPLESTENEL